MADRDGDGLLSAKERRGYNKLALRVIALKNKISANPDQQDEILNDPSLAALYGDFQNAYSAPAGELHPLSELERLEKRANVVLGDDAAAEARADRIASKKESEDRENGQSVASLVNETTEEETLGVGPRADRKRKAGPQSERDRKKTSDRDRKTTSERDRGEPLVRDLGEQLDFDRKETSERDRKKTSDRDQKKPQIISIEDFDDNQIPNSNDIFK